MAAKSKLIFRGSSSWTSGNTWEYDMPTGETIECTKCTIIFYLTSGLVLSASEGHVAIYTSLGYVRLFSIGGIQINVVAIPNIISLICGGERVFLFGMC